MKNTTLVLAALMAAGIALLVMRQGGKPMPQPAAEIPYEAPPVSPRIPRPQPVVRVTNPAPLHAASPRQWRSGPATKEIFRTTYAFHPTEAEFGILNSMAASIESIKYLPHDQFLPELKAIYQNTALQLGEERANDLWRALEPGNAEIAKLVDDYKLDADTVDKWEKLREWGREERQQGRLDEDDFESRLANIINNDEAFKQVKPLATAWLGAEGPSDFGFGKRR